MQFILHKHPNHKWTVTNLEEVLVSFSAIEEAADYLAAAGVLNDEIDLALIELTASEHSLAKFINGKLAATS